VLRKPSRKWRIRFFFDVIAPLCADGRLACALARAITPLRSSRLIGRDEISRPIARLRVFVNAQREPAASEIGGRIVGRPRHDPRLDELIPLRRHLGTLTHANSTYLGRVTTARYMSTHAIKSELLSVLVELLPDTSWSKRASVKQLADFALDTLDRDSSDPRVRRAIELAAAVMPRLS
jgi:hypothetical protein